MITLVVHILLTLFLLWCNIIIDKMFDRRDSVSGNRLKRKSELFSSSDSLNSMLRDYDG